MNLFLAYLVVYLGGAALWRPRHLTFSIISPATHCAAPTHAATFRSGRERG